MNRTPLWACVVIGAALGALLFACALGGAQGWLR